MALVTLPERRHRVHTWTCLRVVPTWMCTRCKFGR